MLFSNKKNISEKEIHLYTIKLENTPIKFSEINFDLSTQDLATVDKFKFDKDRKRFIISRYFLRTLLADYLGTPTKEIRIITNHYGKPELDSTIQKNIQFNISHSGHFILFAINLNNEIGIDIEKIDGTINHLEIAENYFSNDEIRLLKKTGKKEDMIKNFYYIWTRKEALLKAIGIGLLPDLKKISVIYNHFDLDLELNQLNFDKKNIWNIESLEIDNSYKTALAYEGKTKKILIKNIDL